MTLVRAENVSKTYMNGEVEVQALKGLSFEVEPASFVSIVGPSGSGKTTVLNLMGCLDKPTGGDLVVAGKHVNALDRKERAAFRVRQSEDEIARKVVGGTRFAADNILREARDN